MVERLSTADAGRPIPIPGGLVHHWVGLAFLPGVPLDRAVALLQDYDRHAVVYAPRIARSTLRTRGDDLFRFHLRFFMQKGISVVVDTENVAPFRPPACRPRVQLDRRDTDRGDREPGPPAGAREPPGDDGATCGG